ncbi:MAG: cysteine rich repeat-containing protein [Hyphomicrobiales bacterium]|nr:cysteine rich repeat-containing protein [Hyphomicrobiales bacterium]
MRLTLKKLAAAAILAVAAYSPVSAEPAERIIEMIDACRDDYRNFCPGVMPGGGRILSCLAENRDDLTPVCYKAFTVATAIRSCTPDYHALCSHVPPGEDRAVQCLGDHADEVSEICSRALTAALSLHRNEHTSARGYRKPPREHEYESRDEKRYSSEEYRRESYRRYEAPAQRDDNYADEEEEPRILK